MTTEKCLGLASPPTWIVVSLFGLSVGVPRPQQHPQAVVVYLLPDPRVPDRVHERLPRPLVLDLLLALRFERFQHLLSRQQKGGGAAEKEEGGGRGFILVGDLMEPRLTPEGSVTSVPLALSL